MNKNKLHWSSFVDEICENKIYPFSSVTWLSIDVFGFKIPRFEQCKGQYGIARMVAQRAEKLAAFVLCWRFQGFPEGGFFREIDLRITDA